MIEARSTLFGHRVEQVSHEAQYQMLRPASTRSYCPSCKSRTIRFGGCSMNERIGHPAEHLPHWKQRRTELPLRASTFFTNPRFIVSWDNVIFEFFTGTPVDGGIEAMMEVLLPRRLHASRQAVAPFP